MCWLQAHVRDLAGDLHEFSEDAVHNRFGALAEQSSQLATMLDDACSKVGGPAFPLPMEEAQKALDLSSFAGLPEMVRQELLWRFVANGCDSFLSYPAVKAIDFLLARDEPFTWPLGSDWQLSRAGARLLLGKMEKRSKRMWAVGDLLVVQNSMSGLCFRVVRKSTVDNQLANLSANSDSSCHFVLYNLPPNTTVTLRGAEPGDRFCPGLSCRAHPIKLTYFLHREMKAD